MHVHSRMIGKCGLVTNIYKSVLNCPVCTPVAVAAGTTVRMSTHVTPYRMVVFASEIRVKPKKRRPNQRYTPITFEKFNYAYDGWTPTQHYQEARLPSAGSFLFPGLHSVREAAMAELAKPEVTQISIRTNQDRKVYRFIKQHDGRITGYGQLDE